MSLMDAFLALETERLESVTLKRNIADRTEALIIQRQVLRDAEITEARRRCDVEIEQLAQWRDDLCQEQDQRIEAITRAIGDTFAPPPQSAAEAPPAEKRAEQ
jgi:hypothetical protein